MNIHKLNDIKAILATQLANDPTVQAELKDNPPVAVSYSLEEGIVAMYPNTERAKEAYDEAISKGQAYNVKLHNSGLIVSGQFPIPPQLAGMKEELYVATCITSADYLGIEYLEDVKDLISKANTVFLAS